MISALCYVVAYYNIDKIFQTIYLPYIIPNNYDMLYNHKELYFLLEMTSYYMLLLYSYTLLFRLFISKTVNKYCILLSFIYTKHIIDIIVTPNMTMLEYEITRGIMWVFCTPVMLKMYCNTNNISLWDINTQYHIIAIIPHVFMTPFKNQTIYLLSVILCSIPEFIFLKTLYKYNQLPFTNLYLLIWTTFMLINILEITEIFHPDIIHAFYNIANTLCKFVCTVVISNYADQEIIVRENMDLQSVNFVSHIIKSIKDFEIDNQNITFFCKNLINYCKKKFVDKIPLTNDKLKLELLKKILPFNLDIEYIKSGASSYTGSGSNKKFDLICILFMDIMNYTELAKKYNGDIIFKLLDNIYNHFDTIIKKYKYLQKIETIGDAYMVVGDIYRNELNHKFVIKEIILLGLEFIKEIKTIKTPDNVPLCIRIGINMGSVNIGILGNEIPRLCVVGNTVNIAARLQSTAEEDTIQVSLHIYEQVEEIDFGIHIEFIEKDDVFLKNIGTVKTYNIRPNFNFPKIKNPHLFCGSTKCNRNSINDVICFGTTMKCK